MSEVLQDPMGGAFLMSEEEEGSEGLLTSSARRTSRSAWQNLTSSTRSSQLKQFPATGLGVYNVSCQHLSKRAFSCHHLSTRALSCQHASRTALLRQHLSNQQTENMYTSRLYHLKAFTDDQLDQVVPAETVSCNRCTGC